MSGFATDEFRKAGYTMISGTKDAQYVNASNASRNSYLHQQTMLVTASKQAFPSGDSMAAFGADFQSRVTTRLSLRRLPSIYGIQESGTPFANQREKLEGGLRSAKRRR